MHAFRLLGLASLFCFVSVAALAQQPVPSPTQTTQSDPQTVALVQRSLAALTGGAPVSDVTLSGTAHRLAGSDDEIGTAALTATSAGDSRISLAFASGVRTEIRNHLAVPLPSGVPLPAIVTSTPQPVGGWSGRDGVMHGMASHNIATDPAWFFPAMTLMNIVSQSYTVSYVGQETVAGGQQVIHVSASRSVVVPNGTQLPPGPPGMSFTAFVQHLSQVEIYLDLTSMLPTALAFSAHPEDNALIDIPVQIQFSNYQNRSGVAVPLHVQKFVNNSLVLDLDISQCVLNSGVNTSSFQLQ